MKRTIRTLLIPSAVLSILLIACGEPTAPEADQTKTIAKPVETTTATPITYQHEVFASGRLSSSEEAKLSFKTGGIIKKIYVREGQQVRNGQALAELELDEIRAQSQQAEIGKEQAAITIENAKLALQLAERDYANAQGLYKDSVATLEQLQNAEVQLDNARNQLAAAEKGLMFSKQNVDIAQFNLRHSTITAPANGVILKKVAEVNELVGPGTPVFLFGSEDKAPIIRVNVTDKDIIFIQLGDPASIDFDAYPHHTFKGIVREVASMADPYTGTFEVEIEVQAEGRQLLTGFIGTVNIHTKASEDLVAIPIDALVGADEQTGQVFTIENGKAVSTNVRIFKIEKDQILLSAGLTPGTQVVVRGNGYLEESDLVTSNQ
ncbi:MAG: efflux RND transporter periplasmic adaptor subunit [Saprospiraceae bacterium]|nr:efflux RND transporter periplasmic adaptor subunit [Lewinella sp.]